MNKNYRASERAGRAFALTGRASKRAVRVSEGRGESSFLTRGCCPKRRKEGKRMNDKTMKEEKRRENDKGK